MLQRIVMLFCAGFIAVSFADVPAAAKKSELNSLNQSIASVQQDLKKSTQQKSALQSALEKTETTESQLNQHVKVVQAQLAKQKQKLAQLQQQSIPLQQQKSQNNASLKEQVRAAYLMSHQPYLKLLLAPDDVMQTQQTLTYFHYVTQAQVATVQHLEKSITTCVQNQNKIQKQTAALIALKEQQLLNQQALQKSQAQRQALLQTINQQIQTKHQKLMQLLTNKNALESAIRNLSSSPSTSKAVFISNRPFASLRGKLPWPTVGQFRRVFGTPIDQSELKWDGTVIAAPSGQPVRAVASGRVIFAKWMAGYGLLLIINHNNGYMTLYGRNQTINENVGDTVKAGDVIATVGKSGGFLKSALYFSIRHNGQALNPAHWCH